MRIGPLVCRLCCTSGISVLSYVLRTVLNFSYTQMMMIMIPVFVVMVASYVAGLLDA